MTGWRPGRWPGGWPLDLSGRQGFNYTLMSTRPVEVSLEVNPCARLDVIDVRGELQADHVDALAPFPRALYCSFHTTAGYLEQGLAARLQQSGGNGEAGVEPFVKVFQTIFPEGAGYEHDKLHLRTELSDEQRRREPQNADSHLAFIGAGLRTCVTYINRPNEPVYLVDLDGVNGANRRQRLTSIVGFTSEEPVARERLVVPVSAHPIDSVNLKDPRLGLYEQLEALTARYDVAKGRIQIMLAPGERQAGLTVNEYETLLMRHDLAEVLREPLRFMAEKGRSILAHPRAIPNKTLEYAKYDMVRVFNQLFDAFRMNESMVEKLVARVLAYPASRFLRMKRSVSLLVSDREEAGRGRPVQGIYQSPILVQWEKAQGQQREIDIVLTRFR
jgi:thiamine phosphate synthase YjbQ (UPF0047 family)